jgi:exodeoxyribonuclease V alpha subunit
LAYREEKETDLLSLEGTVERILFANEENQYTVARLKVAGQRNLVTIVGNLAALSPGESLLLKGYWTVHPHYGEQFKVENYQTLVPATVEAMERYLGSGLIKGIGPEFARRIVKKFGKHSLDILDEKPQRLLEVEGIGRVRLERIATAWHEQRAVRHVMLFLQGHGVSAGYAAKIYKHYKDEALRILQENPYRLAEDILGIGFKTADAIAMKLGMDMESPLRAQAALLYILSAFQDEGHVFAPREEVLKKAEEELKIPAAVAGEVLPQLLKEGKIVAEGEKLYLAFLYHAEVEVARALAELMKHPPPAVNFNLGQHLSKLETQMGLTLAPQQKEALQKALTQKVLVLTGGPGTGKTTILKGVLSLYRQLGQKVLLAAPTGRAAKKLAEATGQEAKTIHRLLEYNPSKGGFARNEENCLEAYLVVIDEASMMDLPLSYQLLRALAPRSSLLLVGDVNQLPSVGAGNVLRDIIASGKIPMVTLTEIFRQAETSRIVLNAHRINQGLAPFGEDAGNEELSDFYFIEKSDPEEALTMMRELVLRHIPRRFGFHPRDEIQVISPMHKGLVGAANLNTVLQEDLNPPAAHKPEITRGSGIFRQGDKVMQIRNNYDKEVFNGDIGFIQSIDAEEQELVVDFDGRQVLYDFADLEELILAYAISVHKSQGSEYPVIVMPLLTQHYLLLQRNLLYTGVTRARKLVVLVGSKKALNMAVKNDKIQQRYSNLAEKIRGALGG